MDRNRASRRPKLRQLEILLTVADTGSMAKAATRLAVTQPAISRAVADAEHALGVPLFDRGPQGVIPTRYGHALLKRGIAAFDEIDQGVSLVVGAFRANGLDPPRAAVYTHAVNLRVSLAATGPFLAVVAATTVGTPSKYPSVRKLAVDLPTARQAVHIVTLKKRTLSPLARLFLECAREIAAPLARRL